MAEKKDTKLNKKTSVVKKLKASNSKPKASKSSSRKTTKDTQKEHVDNKKVLPNVLIKFRNEAMPDLMKKHQFSTPMAVPKLAKIVINVGLGEALVNSKIINLMCCCNFFVIRKR